MMKIENAKYINQDNNFIEAIVDGQLLYIPTDESNRHYKEILKQNINILPSDKPGFNFGV